ncbi:DEAD/DEAH box helicase, partial [Candidatus Woesearchaeota archaeon]|nr:DEAD/DEAH box helicase [Candidatus Woesearchaeota archaeon]
MTFKDLKLISQIQKAVEKEGYTEPTPIQAQTIPLLLKGKDVMGIAQTGTGKTAAFTLPILQGLFKDRKPIKKNFPRALVLTPTRELAAQIGDSFSTYGQFLDLKHTVIFGGVNQHAQVRKLSKGVDILVATPGRLLDLMKQKHIFLDDIEYFILDEADRMLDMGFIHDVRKVITFLPKKRHSLFFSATMSPQVETLAKSMLESPEHIEVTPQATTVEKIKQRMFFVDHDDKNDLLKELMNEDHLKSVLIFTRTKHRANKVCEFLNKNNFDSAAIHGNKSQNQRTKALSDFKLGKIKVLVATDIAARGIDIDKISHVINYDIPNEAESYVHRIGRTARAGEEGDAYSFCAADER